MATRASELLVTREGRVSPYHSKVVFRTNLITIAYLVAAWYLGRLSWPLAGMVFVAWLLLPFAVVWAWPEHSLNPRWGRTLIGAIGCFGLAITTFILLSKL